MSFYFSAYSTPLLFGFIQGWLYAILLWVRGRRNERLSDWLLGWLLIALCFDIWEYMLGFGGIEILWRQLAFFPRNLSLLLPPLYYFYLRSQVDTTFRFTARHLWHTLPFGLNTAYHLLVFAQGPAFVAQWETRVHGPLYIDMLVFVIDTAQHLLYLYWSMQLYRAYRQWIKTQFSDPDTISFRWFRNFLVALVSTLTISFTMTMVDLWLDLSFWQDWWGNLAGAVLIYYVSISGYAQWQPGRRLTFRESDAEPSPAPSPVANSPETSAEPTRTLLPELEPLRQRLLGLMSTDKPYLEPDLSLPDLARRLHTNPVVLSQVINAGQGVNFNDFVNEYRVAEFKAQVRRPDRAHLSLLGLALDCGFNSKATFNRAFRKATGQSPREFADSPPTAPAHADQ